MKRSRRLASILALALLVVALVGTANATCVQSGRIVYSIHSPVASTYYLLVANAPAWYYIYTTADPVLKSTLSSVHTDGKWVTLWGGGASYTCPTTGTYRPAGALVSPYVAVY